MNDVIMHDIMIYRNYQH